MLELNNQWQKSGEYNIEYFQKSFTKKARAVESLERGSIADYQTESTSVAVNRDLQKQFSSSMRSTLSNEDPSFRAKSIPKSHKVPYPIYHSTKKLTRFNEFKFNQRNADSSKEREADSQQKVEEPKKIDTCSFIQKVPESLSKSVKKPKNWDGCQSKAFDYSTANRQEPDSEEGKTNAEDIIVFRNHKEDEDFSSPKIDFKELIQKAKDHSKSSKNKLQKKVLKEAKIKDLEEVEKELEEIIDKNLQKTQDVNIAFIDLCMNPEVKEIDESSEVPSHNFLDTSIWTLLSSSMSSSSNINTVVLSSADVSEYQINQEYIFGGAWDIDAIIQEQEKYQ